MSRVLGLDIGATGTRARLVADGVVISDATASSASLTAVGPRLLSAAGVSSCTVIVFEKSRTVRPLIARACP